jgi:gliding motility-associatede transport system auxiliary component
MSTDRKKKRTYASNTLLYALFIVGAIVVVNLLGTRVFGRLDLTESKVYTLSQPSKDLVKKLPDFMTVKTFISDDLPPEMKAVSRYVRDLIDEYKTSSNGKFTWHSIDPGKDKKLEEEASRCKVQKVQIQRIGGQKFEIGAYYLGLCI